MRYRDLIQFEPLETVIQLREADDRERIRQLVRTYVISDRMADQLIDGLLPQLRFDQPGDHKGLLVVGNYGTGKSHLMSVLSGVAEHDDLAGLVNHPRVAAAVQPIAGRFQVLRTEVGATQMPLRDILFSQLEGFLAERGIEYRFPSLREVSNSKDPLVAMMERFDERYRDQGLLIVVDELLEYLRGRHETDLIVDLNFMREVGEVARLTRLRFMGGVQEALFDAPRFQFVADTLRRVRDRFEQVRLTRTDVAYVVAERLLRKTPDQRAWIHQHLARFAPLYPNMAERLDDFVRLFPVHPSYLDVFERLTLVEKRQALQTLTRSIRTLLDTEVPTHEPGLLSYDGYWEVIQQDSSLRSVPEVREVVEKSSVLEERVRTAFVNPRSPGRHLAPRLVRALSVLRLTTGDIYAPLGATAQELRDGLCLYVPMPELEADFLLTSVEAALRDILRTVNGQFISFNRENGQYYLDLKKDIDYDTLIEEKGRSLGPDKLDHYYFETLKRVLECTDSTYVPGARIWAYELSWVGHRVTRPGYLFFGAPNERSTAQPPREFYLYFLQPYESPPFEDPHRSDEVFFRLVQRDDAFEQALRTYAGAREIAAISSGQNLQVYTTRANDALQTLQRWLRQNMPQAMTLTYAGTTRRLAEWPREAPRLGAELSIRDLVNSVASACLSPAFNDRYPGYPAFRGLRNDITEETRRTHAQEAIRYLTGTRTQPGTHVLDGLELLADGQVRPRHSRYARHILDQLQGQVVNRAALLVTQHGVERDARFRLEAEWLVVVLLALVYSGDLVLQLPGERLDAGNLDRAARLPVETLTQFRFIERPRDIPYATWIAVFELLELSPGLIQSPATHEAAVEMLQRAVDAELDRVVRTLEQVRRGILLWQVPLLEPSRQSEVSADLTAYKTFLDSLRVFNQPGKLRNLSHSAADVAAQRQPRDLLQSLSGLLESVATLQPLTGYLREVEAVLPTTNPLSERIQRARVEQLERLHGLSSWVDPTVRQALQRELEELRGDYIEEYTTWHRAARLGQEEERERQALLAAPLLKRLEALRGVTLLSPEPLDKLVTPVKALKRCAQYIPRDVHQQPICPHCGYRPTDEVKHTDLALVVGELERLQETWTRTLLSELERPDVQTNVQLLDGPQRTLLESFARNRRLPDRIPDGFVAAVNDALRGLERLSIPIDGLVLALTGDGTPMTPDQFQQRFQHFLEAQVAGHARERVRLSLDW